MAVFLLCEHSGPFGDIASGTEKSWKPVCCIVFMSESVLQGVEMVLRLGLAQFGEVMGQSNTEIRS